ncbi:MAG: S8 family peptidase [Acidobacteria bacterium]|nr:S8 family peptidase [Acidobacteriota bacterium]
MSITRRLRAAVAAFLLLLTTQAAFAASSGHPKVDRALRDSLLTGAATQHVIITVKAGYRAEIRQSLEKHGDKIKSEHPLIGALAAEIHSGDVTELANHPWVDSVSIDATCYAGAAHGVTSNNGGRAALSSLATQPYAAVAATLRQTLGLPRQSDSHTPSGAGIGVAVIDSGIAPSDDFEGRITAFYDFTRGGIPTQPYDDYGHGTHVAGLIGSGGKLSDYQYQGVAPEVRFVGLKVLDRNGAGSTSDVIKALEYVAANHTRLNVQIVNLSLGHPIYEPAKTDPLVQAVEKAAAEGLIVVTAAGNYGQNKQGTVGYTGINSPANAPSAFTVGAAMTNDTVSRDDDKVADYSSRGPTWYDGFAKPDVVAPGHHLTSDTNTLSTLFAKLTNSHRAVKGHNFLQLSGTSMAAAVASGVITDVLDAHNRAGYWHAKPLTPNAVKAILEYSSIPVAGADSLSQGAGELNAAGAIALTTAIDTTEVTGGWWLRMGVPAHTALGTTLYAWGQQVIWGETVYTGDLVYYNLSAWGLGVEWGTKLVGGTAVLVKAPSGAQALVKASNIVWGTNIVWGDRIIGQSDGENIVWGTADGENIVWGTLDDENIVWGTVHGNNIVWGTSADGENIVWGTSRLDNIVWGTSNDENIVWGTTADNIVWGTAVASGKPGGIF